MVVCLWSCDRRIDEKPAIVPTDTLLPSVTSAGNESKELAGIYSAVISEYIGRHRLQIHDTLYIGRHPEFPSVNLPATIAGINISLVDGDKAVAYFAGRHDILYLNVMAWIENHKAEFLIVTFRDFSPQHNMHLYFSRNGNEVVPDSMGMEYPYGHIANKW